MTPATFEQLNKGTDQNAKVFRALVNGKDKNEGWVSAPVLCQAGETMNLSKRISELRLIHGLNIENKILKSNGSPKKYSFYRMATVWGLKPQGVLKL